MATMDEVTSGRKNDLCDIAAPEIQFKSSIGARAPTRFE
jgi:hypothetical protein